MLKSVLYYLLLLTTSLRFVDLLYLLTRDSTNLPIPVILIASALVLYGVVLLVKRFVTPIRLKQLMVFYAIQAALVLFNIAFVSVTCPLQISAVETMTMGTFLDVLVSGGAVWLCLRQMRVHYLPMIRPITESRQRINV